MTWGVKRSSAAAVAAIAALSFGACSDDDGEPSGLETAPPTSSPTEPPTDEPTVEPTTEPTPDDPAPDPASDDAIIAAYLDAKDAYVEAYNPADPEHPGLIAWFDGNALEGYQTELDGLVADGHSEVIEYDLHPEVIINEGGTAAIVNDCYGVEVTTIDTESGDPVGQAQSYTRNTDFSLQRRDDQWVIVNYHHLESECTPAG